MKKYIEKAKRLFGQINNRDFTIVLQGKLYDQGLSHLSYYVQFGRVVVSYWEDSDKELEEYYRNKFPKVIFHKIHYPQYYYNNHFNIFLQAKSTLEGVQLAETPYVIKLRTDESYTNLIPLIKKIRKNPQKLITNNVFFKANSVYQYHPSDHVFGGSTDKILSMLGQICSVCQNTNTVIRGDDIGILHMHTLCPEQLFAICFLRISGEKPTVHNSLELMQRWVDCVPVKKLGDIVITHKDDKDYTKRHYIRSWKDLKNSINDMSEFGNIL